jgi:hypothetical protein
LCWLNPYVVGQNPIFAASKSPSLAVSQEDLTDAETELSKEL